MILNMYMYKLVKEEDLCTYECKRWRVIAQSRNNDCLVLKRFQSQIVNTENLNLTQETFMWSRCNKTWHLLDNNRIRCYWHFRSKTELWEKKGGWPNEKTFYTILPQPVSSTAMKASASPRVETLAEHKPINRNFRPEKPIRYDF